ncbi:cuticle protein 21-like [Homarus americanus]|uniref:cuticle protein 21-like n=1 Tax=Homarus americanus TaxID=6706 RepID=UPI001C48A5FA|nr:cuticle protein 21-like [Homarus americanus]
MLRAGPWITPPLYNVGDHLCSSLDFNRRSFTMALKVLVVSALVAVTLALPENRPVRTYGVPPPPTYGAPPPPPPPPPTYGAPAPAPAYGTPAPVSPPKYDFSWEVKDHYDTDFGHQETRDGYDTQGSYYVLLPDGRLQKVDYTVNGDSGFVAEVTFEGDTKYPAPQPSYTPAPAPTYGPPAQTYQPAPTYA